MYLGLNELMWISIKQEAARLFAKQCTSDILEDFLTTEAYKGIVSLYPEIVASL